MSKPRLQSAKPKTAQRHARNLWRWGIAAAFGAILAALVFQARRSNPTRTVETPPSSAFLPTVENKTPPSGPAPEGMVWIPGGEFSMGSTVASEAMCGLPGLTRDAQPIHRVYVDGYWMDATEVTNEQFEKFVKATGYVTVAEQTPTKEEFPPRRRRISSPVPPFSRRHRSRAVEQLFSVVALRARRELASSRPGPTAISRGARNIPWCKSPTRMPPPTRSGRANACRPRRNGNSPRAAALAGKLYAWGDELKPGGKLDGEHLSGPVSRWRRATRARMVSRASRPSRNFRRTATASTTWPATSGNGAATGIGPTLTRGRSWRAAWRAIRRDRTRPYDPAEPTEKKRVHRGGSFLCTDQYCTRYMVGTRGKGEVRTASNHLGFRCVQSASTTANGNKPQS